MKKGVILVLLSIIVLGVLTSSCAQGEITRTVTIPPSGTNTLTVTVTASFETDPPDIPHTFLLDNPRSEIVESLISQSGGSICFECHGVPPQHSVWFYDSEICLDCHEVSNNPVLVPEWPLPPDDSAGS